MPVRPPKACKCGGVRRSGRCDRCGKLEGRGTAAQRGYGADWRKARRLFLADNPLCQSCMRAGRTTGATVVDHVTPHQGDKRLFWARSNWQALCRQCHDAKTRREQQYE